MSNYKTKAVVSIILTVVIVATAVLVGGFLFGRGVEGFYGSKDFGNAQIV